MLKKAIHNVWTKHIVNLEKRYSDNKTIRVNRSLLIVVVVVVVVPADRGALFSNEYINNSINMIKGRLQHEHNETGLTTVAFPISSERAVHLLDPV